MWFTVHDQSANKLYCAGQAGSGLFQATMEIDLSDDSVSFELVPLTADADEFFPIIDDGTNIIAAERHPGSEVWQLPKATYLDDTTFSLLHADPSGYRWWGLVKYGANYYGLLTNDDGAYLIKSSSDLTTWSTDVDGSALSEGYRRWGSMVVHSGQNKVYAVTTDGSRNVILHEYNGVAWSTTDLGIDEPNNNMSLMALDVFGDYLVLRIGHGWVAGTGSTNHRHNVYIVDSLSTTPSATLLFDDLPGTTGIGADINGSDLYYGRSYHGALMQLNIVES